MKDRIRVKRKITAVVISVLLLSLTLPVFQVQADLLLEPWNNNFYDRNKNRCVQMMRMFYTNGEDGYVYVSSEPGPGNRIHSYTNGVKVYIQYTYDHNGEIWGVMETRTGSQDPELISGWIPMEQLRIVYDQTSFTEDFKHEFYTYTGDPLPLENDLVIWEWPGSGNVKWVRQFDPRQAEIEESWLKSNTTYRDSEGREWVQIAYFYAHRDNWICFSDPSNEEIPAFNPAPDPMLWPAAHPPEGLQNGQELRERLLPALAVILVVSVSVTTVILIRVFWKK